VAGTCYILWDTLWNSFTNFNFCWFVGKAGDKKQRETADEKTKVSWRNLVLCR